MAAEEEEWEEDSQVVEWVEDQEGEQVLWEGRFPEADQVHPWGALEDDFKVHWKKTEISTHIIFLSIAQSYNHRNSKIRFNDCIIYRYHIEDK